MADTVSTDVPESAVPGVLLGSKALRRILDMFEAEIARPTDVGSTKPRSQGQH